MKKNNSTIQAIVLFLANWKTWLNKFGTLLALFLVFAFFALLNAKITTLTAIETIFQQTVIVGI